MVARKCIARQLLFYVKTHGGLPSLQLNVKRAINFNRNEVLSASPILDLCYSPGMP
jgi:hypothetical protein